MKKQKREISQSRIIHKIYEQQKNKSAQLYRFFRVYHPVYDIAVNIDIARQVDEYHIIEKYMDKMVCGYVGDNGIVTGKCYVENRKQLYELLGLEHQAYEVAERFFEDLIMAGHFKETPDGIYALNAAQESIKMQKKVLSSTEHIKKTFDAFSMQLVPTEFYELAHFAVDIESVQKEEDNVKYSAWLNPDYIRMNNVVELENALRTCEYTGQEILEKGLPQGYSGMRVAADPEVELKFIPYYLAVYKEKNGFSYQAYRVDNAQPIEWISEMYMTSAYATAVQTIQSLSERVEKGNVHNPIWSKFALTKAGQACSEEGVVQRNDGNYEWTLQNWQVEKLLEDDGEEFNGRACKIIADNDIAVLTRFDAGKIVYIHKSDKQKTLLLEAVRK